MNFRPHQSKPTFFDRLEALFWLISGWIRNLTVAGLQLAERGVNWLCSKVSPALIMGLFCAILGSVLVNIGIFGIDLYFEGMNNFVILEESHRKVLIEQGVYRCFAVVSPILTGIGLYLCLLSLLGILKRKLFQRLHKSGVAAATLGYGYVLYYLLNIPAILLFNNLVGKKEIFDKFSHHSLLISGVWGWVFFAFIIFWYAVTTVHSRSFAYYSGSISDSERWGDKIVSSVHSGGDDPEFKESSRWSLWWHIFILFILPLLSFRWMTPYEIPKGSGVQAPQVVKVVKKKKKKQDKMVFNPNSAISYIRPDIDDVDIMKEVLIETEAQYEVTSNAAGKLGAGGGKKGGWPNGMDNARVRFIRLEYTGGNWDQSMGGGADYNFLLKFKEITGFNIWKETESIRVSDLRNFPKGKGPPFVYLTGGNHREGFGSINMSGRDIKTLRWYVKEQGGMIFADNGGDGFNASFRSVMRKVLPKSNWIDISNDDILYRQPFLFPNGAPTIQAHSGGGRGLGMKSDDGRWMVFYHQGDLKDAWKDGASGFTKSVQMASFKMGINVVNYAFNQYLSIHFEK